MPLVTSKEILSAALENHFAVGAFNANNMEQIQGIVEAAEEERAPVIEVPDPRSRLCEGSGAGEDSPLPQCGND